MSMDKVFIGDSNNPLLVNGRIRDGGVAPVQSPLQESGLPSGVLQGVYTADNLTIVFKNGEAYYKDYRYPDTAYTQVVGFQMATTGRLYAVLVPASTLNFKRQAGTNANDAVSLTDAVTETKAAVIVQDGVNQPWIIDTDGIARVSNNYGQWSAIDREYIPIGTTMVYDDGILWVVNGNKLLRSVSGRPFDFMVVIDVNGNSIAEADGNADKVSHAVSFAPITCIKGLNTPAGELYVGSDSVSHTVTRNTTTSLFGEPTFNNQRLFSAAAINDRSFAEILNDQVFIDKEGLRSFTAIRTGGNEGRQEHFSKSVALLFKGIKQSNNGCVGRYDNYTFFSVDTVYGPAMLVYDEQRKVFVSLDIYNGLGKIEFIQNIRIAEFDGMIIGDTNGNVYQYENGIDYERCQLYVGDFKGQTNSVLEHIIAQFNNVYMSGVVKVTPYVDAKALPVEQRYIGAKVERPSGARALPFGDGEAKDVAVVEFATVHSVEEGIKYGAWVEWAFDAVLLGVTLVTKDTKNVVPKATKAIDRITYEEYEFYIETVSHTAPTIGEIITVTGVNLDRVEFVWANDTMGSILSQTSTELTMSFPTADSGYLYFRSENFQFESQSITIA